MSNTPALSELPANLAGDHNFSRLRTAVAWLLVKLFPEWSGERWPLYALCPSRRFLPAKLEAFLDFCTAALQTRVTQRKSRVEGGTC